MQRESDPLHGMPEAVASVPRAKDQLRLEGPHAPSTVRRRLAHWSTLHRWRGLTGPFGVPNVRQALRLATRAARHPRGRKSERPVTRDVLDQLLATCEAGSPSDLRDRALLLVAFASGGRRRSEAASLRVADLIVREPVVARRSGCGTLIPIVALHHTAPSNEAFDWQLRSSNSDWGVRDLEAVTEMAASHGLALGEVIAMPAHNLSIVFRPADIP